MALLRPLFTFSGSMVPARLTVNRDDRLALPSFIAPKYPSLVLKRRLPLYVFLGLSLAGLASFLALWCCRQSWDHVLELGPATNVYALSVSLGTLWCLSLASLTWISYGRLTADRVVTLVCAALICLLYLNVLREHVVFKDFTDYTAAAQAIIAGDPFPWAYVYPPLWASVLGGMQVAFGQHGPVVLIFALNQASIVVFFLLGVSFLCRCGVSRGFAAPLLLAAMMVNVPILRNTVYNQVNLLVLDLVLVSILFYPKAKFISATFLALATHIKVIPALFAPLFLDRRHLSWPLYFGFSLVFVACLTVWLHGVSYYFDFLHNLTDWKPAALRSSSFYSLLVRTGKIFYWELPVDFIYNALRALFTIWIAAVTYTAIRHCSFARSDNAPADRAVNGLVPLLFLMPALATAVWAHHHVLLILPAILTLLRMNSTVTLLLWSAAYSTIFWMPVFDWYPWSYLRLAAWITLLGLLSRAVFVPEIAPWARGLENAVVEAITRLRRLSDNARA